MSEPSLTPGSARHIHFNPSPNDKKDVTFSQLSRSIRGTLLSPSLAGDYRETICFALLGQEPEEKLLIQFATMARHHFQWLSRDVWFLWLNSNSSSLAQEVESLLFDYNFNSTKVMPRTGVISTAVVFSFSLAMEKQSMETLRLVGRNGRLPNMDLINTAIGTSTAKRGVNFYGVDSRLSTRAFGMEFAREMLKGSNGLHSSFMDFNIESISIELGRGTALERMEAMLRSLSFLGEAWNRSFFYYIMLSPTSFVSVDEYLWALVLFLAPLGIGALSLKEKHTMGDKNSRRTWISSIESLGFAQVCAHMLCHPRWFPLGLMLTGWFIMRERGFHSKRTAMNQALVFAALMGLGVVHFPFALLSASLALFSNLVVSSLRHPLVSVLVGLPTLWFYVLVILPLSQEWLFQTVFQTVLLPSQLIFMVTF